jgi:hypothetical protein
MLILTGRRVLGGTPIGGSGVVEAPLYTLPHKENGTSISWNTTTDAPAEDMWDFRTVPAVTGSTHNVTTGAEFSTALTNATYGDEIVIAAGTTITGEFTIPNKSWSSGWITVRVANASSNLPSGTRIVAGDATDMATIRATSGGGKPLTFAASASHWRFIGLIITNESGVTNQSALIDLTPSGGSWSSVATAVNNIAFDRCWIKGQTAAGEQRHGIALGGENIAVVDCRFTGLKENGGESHDIWGGNYLRRLHVHNCYLSADGINLFFGGATPTQMSGSYSGTAPQDIIVSRCEFTKDLARYPSSGTYKNLFETKNSQYGLIWGCVLHGFRSGDEQDMVLNFNTANQDFLAGLADDIRGQHWTVRACSFYDCEGDILRVAKNLTVGYVTDTLHHVEMSYCLVYDPFASSDPSSSFFQMASVDQVPEVTVRNCTVLYLNTGGKYYYVDSDAIGTYTPFGHRFYNNALAYDCEYGFFTADVSASTALNTIFGTNNWRMDHNPSIHGYGLDTGGTPDNTGTNTTLANLAAFLFTDAANDDYSLQSGSPLKNAGSDGRDIGCHWSTLQTNISGVVTG